MLHHIAFGCHGRPKMAFWAPINSIFFKSGGGRGGGGVCIFLVGTGPNKKVIHVYDVEHYDDTHSIITTSVAH